MPITIHVHSRDTSQAWFMGEGNSSYLRDMLQTYLRRSTPMTNLEAKRLVRAIPGPVHLTLGVAQAGQGCQCATRDEVQVGTCMRSATKQWRPCPACPSGCAALGGLRRYRPSQGAYLASARRLASHPKAAQRDPRALGEQALAGQAVDLVLVDPQFCDGICHWLSQLGASLEVEGDTGDVFQPPTPR